MLKKVAVFISGGGSNMLSLIDKQESYEVVLVISGKSDALGLEKAKERGIPAVYIGKENYPEVQARTKATLTLLKESQVDYIALAGYLNIIPDAFIQAYPNKIINIHPSLIPSFCGMGYHGSHVHEAVYHSGVKVTGATVHFVTEVVDGGAIILQEVVEVAPQDSPEMIGRKVLKIEHRIFPKAMNLLASNKIIVEEKRTFFHESKEE